MFAIIFSPLNTIDAESLLAKPLVSVPCLVEELLTPGLYVLAGAPKIGKSWLTLWLCMQVAAGKPVWKFPSHPSAVLYLCLEDHEQRIQNRLSALTADCADDFSSLHFSTEAQPLLANMDSGLLLQLNLFVLAHPDTRLIAIDTLQRIRTAEEMSYGSDYNDIALLKQFADQRQLTVLVVHHLRKMKDDDPLNRISGTTGISGAADGILVLMKSKRSEQEATLICTGRDIAYRELQLSFDRETMHWSLLTDSITDEPLPSEELLEHLLTFLSSVHSFSGTAAELSDALCAHCGTHYAPNTLSRKIRSAVSELSLHSITLRSRRTHGKRLMELACVGCVSCVGSGGAAAKKLTQPTRWR